MARGLDPPRQDRAADPRQRLPVRGAERVDLRLQHPQPCVGDPPRGPQPAAVSVTCTVRRSSVPRERVTSPSASSRSTTRTSREWLSPRLHASRSIGLPLANAASAVIAAPRPPGPAAASAVTASSSVESASTAALRTFAACSSGRCMLGAYISVDGSPSCGTPDRSSMSTMADLSSLTFGSQLGKWLLIGVLVLVVAGPLLAMLGSY